MQYFKFRNSFIWLTLTIYNFFKMKNCIIYIFFKLTDCKQMVEYYFILLRDLVSLMANKRQLNLNLLNIIFLRDSKIV